ncbi:flavin reductase (NADPH)-like [Monomorium pharaonis]|uniref:flavin reductase (NADPH)-like n=1 Tax=Monomorium pharaonis TaxID=307658 RepID=UPI00174631C6|nr:flavin reductase (NADPH)-like [Monomorium pharaonis]
MKRVVIFGSTGVTGLCSLRTAVEKGLEVRVLVRDKNKIPKDLIDKVEAVIGDVTNAEDVAKAVAGTDAVVVILGIGKNLSPSTVLSEGMQNIINAMKAHNVELVSVCLSGFLFYTLEETPAMCKDLTIEHQRMFDITKSSGLKWVAVFPPWITGAPKSKYTVTIDSVAGRVISKHDLGAFLVECLENPDYYQKIVGLATQHKTCRNVKIHE